MFLPPLVHPASDTAAAHDGQAIISRGGLGHFEDIPGASAIPSNLIAFGNGTGITSDTNLTYSSKILSVLVNNGFWYDGQVATHVVDIYANDGSITEIQAQNGGTSFPFVLPLTPGSAGQVLTSSGSTTSWQGIFNTTYDSLSITGQTINLNVDSTYIIDATTTFTDLTLNFPQGKTGDYIIINNNQPITSLSVTGVNVGTISASKITNSSTAGVKIFNNVNGNWH